MLLPFVKIYLDALIYFRTIACGKWRREVTKEIALLLTHTESGSAHERAAFCM